MKRYITNLLVYLFPLLIAAQCPQENKAFKSGERLEYKLFFNWKFVWLTAGTATMQTHSVTYHGKPCFKTELLTRTSKRIDKFFCMRDTLECTVTQELVPLYYRKGANEGGQYRLNEVWYDYPQGKCNTRIYYRKDNNAPQVNELQHAACVYDMLSMMVCARSFRASDFKVGQRMDFLMADHRDVKSETIVYRGIKEFTTEDEDKITYRCLVFSFVEKDKKGKDKEIITFYITDDDNHIPVRLDLFLRFGTAKAFLSKATGLRNPQTSIVKQKKKK